MDPGGASGACGADGACGESAVASEHWKVVGKGANEEWGFVDSVLDHGA